MPIDWESALLPHKGHAETNLWTAQMTHEGGSTGYVADTEEWGRRFTQLGGPLDEMWGKHSGDSLEHALLMGRFDDYWLAVRPRRRKSDGRRVTEIFCALSSSPLSALERVAPEVTSTVALSRSVGSHSPTNTSAGNVEMGAGATLEDIIQCWSMTLESKRSTMGIASVCDMGTAASMLPSPSRWITMTPGTSDSGSDLSDEKDDPLRILGAGTSLLDRASLLHALERLASHSGIDIWSLMMLYVESAGTPRYAHLDNSKRIPLHFSLDDREGAFEELTSALGDRSAVSAWTGQVGGNLPFLDEELDTLASDPGLDVWEFLRGISGGPLGGVERDRAIQLLNRSRLSSGLIPSFLRLCPDYLAGRKPGPEIRTLEAMEMWDVGNPLQSTVKICEVLNRCQPPSPEREGIIERRALNLLTQPVPTDGRSLKHSVPQEPVRLSSLISDDDAYSSLIRDRDRMAPFMNIEAIQFAERSKWTEHLEPEDLLEITKNRAMKREEWGIVQQDIKSVEQGFVGSHWGVPKAVPSKAEINRLGDLDKPTLMGKRAELLAMPTAIQRLAYFLPGILLLLTMTTAAAALSSLIWVLVLALGLQDPLLVSVDLTMLGVSAPVLFEGIVGTIAFLALGTAARSSNRSAAKSKPARGRFPPLLTMATAAAALSSLIWVLALALGLQDPMLGHSAPVLFEGIGGTIAFLALGTAARSSNRSAAESKRLREKFLFIMGGGHVQ